MDEKLVEALKEINASYPYPASALAQAILQMEFSSPWGLELQSKVLDLASRLEALEAKGVPVIPAVWRDVIQRIAALEADTGADKELGSADEQDYVDRYFEEHRPGAAASREYRLGYFYGAGDAMRAGKVPAGRPGPNPDGSLRAGR